MHMHHPEEIKITNSHECKELILFTAAYDASMLGLITRAIEDKYGEEGYNTIKEAMCKKGELDARELKEHNITFNNFQEFGRFFGASLNGIVNSIISPKEKMEIRGESEVILTHTDCVRCQEWKKLGLTNEMMQKLCDLYFGSFEAYMRQIFPELQVIKKKLIPRGDDVCKIVFKK